MDKAHIQSYCLMCRTGTEVKVCRQIHKHYPDLEAFAPTRIIEEKRKRVWQSFEKVLLPGYVFLYAKADLPHDLIRTISHAYKILAYEKGLRALQGEDRDYALWLYRYQGTIASSKVLQTGETVAVVEGPLKDLSGKIIKLDKRKRKAWVSFIFDGLERIVSLSAHCLVNE